MTHEEIFNYLIDNPQNCDVYGTRAQGSNYIHLEIFNKENDEECIDIECWVDDRRYEESATYDHPAQGGYEVDAISIESVEVNGRTIVLNKVGEAAAERFIAEWLEEDYCDGGECTNIEPMDSYYFMRASMAARKRWEAAKANN